MLVVEPNMTDSLSETRSSQEEIERPPDPRPKVYRSMQSDEHRPRVSSGRPGKLLSVRVPVDIRPNASGDVHPGTKGMCVINEWRRLPAHLIIQPSSQTLISGKRNPHNKK